MKPKSRDLAETIAKVESLRTTIQINPKCWPNLELSPVEQHSHDALPKKHWTAMCENPNGSVEDPIEVCAVTFVELIDKLWEKFSEAASDETL